MKMQESHFNRPEYYRRPLFKTLPKRLSLFSAYSNRRVWSGPSPLSVAGHTVPAPSDLIVIALEEGACILAKVIHFNTAGLVAISAMSITSTGTKANVQFEFRFWDSLSLPI